MGSRGVLIFKELSHLEFEFHILIFRKTSILEILNLEAGQGLRDVRTRTCLPVATSSAV